MLIDGHLREELADDSKVPVLVLDVTEAEADLILATHDPLTSMAETDQALLDELVQGLDIDNDETQKMLDDLASDPVIEVVEDEVPEVPDEPTTKLGDLFELGDHRLLCGDCTSADNVARLMDGQLATCVFTDPPYGISALGGRRQTNENKNIADIINDDARGDDLVKFITASLLNCQTTENASLYVCYGWKSQQEFTQAIKDAGLTLRATITWVKNVFGLSAKNNYGYRPQTEFVYFATKCEGYDFAWFGGGTQSDVWNVPRPTERHGNHPTPKPVELVSIALKNSTDKRDIVFDPFLGSGTTLIAAEQLGRKCYGMEISPAYCDVIIQRWENLTGKKAKKV